LPALLVLLGSVGVAYAEPSAEEVREAGISFDAGRTAFREDRFEEAAEHFERADTLAPNAQVLLNAMVARAEAGQSDRAASLGALILERYPDDTAVRGEAERIVADAKPRQHRLTVVCDEPCAVLVGTRLLHGPRAEKQIVFLKPGQYAIKASFGDKRVADKTAIAKAGSESELSFVAPPRSAAEAEPMDAPVSASDEPGPLDTGARPEAKKPLSPVVFFVGAGLTAAAAGVSIWSALDTQNNPGPDVVRERCRGLGTSCPEYQDGLDKQLRTNVLWGVTGALGVTTALVGILFTDFSGGEDATSDIARPQLGVAPFVAGAGSVGLATWGQF
jgi:hypothetical protein